MPFQFLCPQGHLLQGDEAHMGMQTQCPQCGVIFLIPRIDAAAPESSAYSQYEQYESYTGDPLQQQPGLADYLSNLGGTAPGSELNPAGLTEPDPASFVPGSAGPGGIRIEVTGETAPRAVHISCPNGHELEVPVEMLGQEALCPHCRAQFLLRNEDSREYQQEQERIERQKGNAWFTWSVVAAVIVLISLVVMIVVASSS